MRVGTWLEEEYRCCYYSFNSSWNSVSVHLKETRITDPSIHVSRLGLDAAYGNLPPFPELLTCLLHQSCEISGIDLCSCAFVLSHPKLFYLMLVSGKECYFCIPHDKGNGCNFSPSKDREIDEGWWGRKGVEQKEVGGGKWDALRRKRWEKKSIHTPPPLSVSSIVPPNRLQAECL